MAAINFFKYGDQPGEIILHAISPGSMVDCRVAGGILVHGYPTTSESGRPIVEEADYKFPPELKEKAMKLITNLNLGHARRLFEFQSAHEHNRPRPVMARSATSRSPVGARIAANAAQSSGRTTPPQSKPALSKRVRTINAARTNEQLTPADYRSVRVGSY